MLKTTLLACVLLAPAPVYRQPDSTPVGEWEDGRWSTVVTRFLFKDGKYDCDYMGSHYYGYYTWDASTRTLTVKEWQVYNAGAGYVVWTAVLDADLKGVAKRSGTETNIHLKKRSK